jgi:hypothetical protein
VEFLLYVLVFLFGYVTHRTFSTYKNAKASILLLQSSVVASLLILARCLQNYSYVKSFGANQLEKKEASSEQVDNYKLLIDNDIKFFKKSSVSQILKDIPEHFSTIIEFNDWDSAMKYLDDLNTKRGLL